MRICFDLDGTLCEGLPYETAKPFKESSSLLKYLKSNGHTIIIQTARGMGSSAGNSGLALSKIGSITFSQLQQWDFVYDEIYFGKPSADIYIDDKSIKSIDNLVPELSDV